MQVLNAGGNGASGGIRLFVLSAKDSKMYI
jgi:hypothetical protein